MKATSGDAAIAFYVGWIWALPVRSSYRAVVVDEAMTALSADIRAWVPELARRVAADRRDVLRAAADGVVDFLLAIAISGSHIRPESDRWYRAVYDAASAEVLQRFRPGAIAA